MSDEGLTSRPDTLPAVDSRVQEAVPRPRLCEGLTDQSLSPEQRQRALRPGLRAADLAFWGGYVLLLPAAARSPRWGARGAVARTVCSRVVTVEFKRAESARLEGNY